MPSEKPDWFKMNPAQFLQDGLVDAMSTLELGAAFRLLCRQWIDGDLADDKALLARSARLTEEEMDRAWPLLSQFFPLTPTENGRRANRFMWVERETVAAKCESKSDTFRALARKRWDNAKKDEDQPTDGNPEGNAARNAKRNAPRMRHAMQEKSREEKSREEAATPPQSLSEARAQKEALPLADENQSPRLRPDAFVTAWNENRGELPKVLELSEDRRKKLQTRIRGGLTIERFTKAVKVCANTSFLTGDNDRHWRADFDWLIGNDSNILKVLEGKYGDSSAPRPLASPHREPESTAPHPSRVIDLKSVRLKAAIQ